MLLWWVHNPLLDLEKLRSTLHSGSYSAWLRQLRRLLFLKRVMCRFRRRMGNPQGFWVRLGRRGTGIDRIFACGRKDGFALPVGCFEFAMFGALFGDLDFAVCCVKLGINFLLAFRTDAFGFTQIIAPPAIASTIKAKVAASSTWLRCARIYVYSQQLMLK